MTIHFAPIQGFTTHIYRYAHKQICGGVDYYYTPFIRLEKGGIRTKDLREILPENNIDMPTIPQLICSGREEFCRLTEIIEESGWHRIDINMGCPFPMQTQRGRGAGLLSRTKAFEEIAKEIISHREILFSVKMRLGGKDPSEWRKLIPTLNDLPLSHITVHPRVATQLYRGHVDMDSFASIFAESAHPIVYNGDISCAEQIRQLEKQFPQLQGVMIGRGLLASPTLAYEYTHQSESLSDKDKMAQFWSIHDILYEYAIQHLQGDSQILSNLHALWEYPCPLIDKKSLKKITKSGSLRSYNEGIAAAKRFLD